MVVGVSGALDSARVRIVVVQTRLRAQVRSRVPKHWSVTLRDNVFILYDLEILVFAQVSLTLSISISVRCAGTLRKALLNSYVDIHAQCARVIAVKAAVHKAFAPFLTRVG